MRLKLTSFFTAKNNQIILFYSEDWENKFPYTRGQFRPNLEDIPDNMQHLNNDRARRLHTLGCSHQEPFLFDKRAVP